MAAAAWISEWIGVILVALLVALIGHVAAWRTRAGYRRSWQRFLSRVPIVKDLLLMNTLGVIFQNLRVLYSRGIDLVRALEITRDAVSNEWHLQLFSQVTHQITQGYTLTHALRGAKLFPTVAVTIVSAGERSGTLDAQFAYLAQHYMEKLDQLTSRLSEIIKPLIVVVAGGFFIFMIVALLLPVYDLVKQTMATMK